MTKIRHSELVGPDLHEPKGFAEKKEANHVYVTDGKGSGVFKPFVDLQNGGVPTGPTQPNGASMLGKDVEIFQFGRMGNVGSEEVSERRHRSEFSLFRGISLDPFIATTTRSVKVTGDYLQINDLGENDLVHLSWTEKPRNKRTSNGGDASVSVSFKTVTSGGSNVSQANILPQEYNNSLYLRASAGGSVFNRFQLEATVEDLKRHANKKTTFIFEILNLSVTIYKNVMPSTS